MPRLSIPILALLFALAPACAAPPMAAAPVAAPAPPVLPVTAGSHEPAGAAPTLLPLVGPSFPPPLADIPVLAAIPPDVPPSQAVRFHFQGSTTAVVSHGSDDCEAMTITRVEAGMAHRVPLKAQRECLCGAPCAQPRMDVQFSPASALRAPDGSPGIQVWDARALDPSLQRHHCQPSRGDTMSTHYARKPVLPGHYRVVFATAEAGDWCDGASCYRQVNGAKVPIPHQKSACDVFITEATCKVTPSYACAEFDLPASTDVDVTVPLR